VKIVKIMMPWPKGWPHRIIVDFLYDGFVSEPSERQLEQWILDGMGKWQDIFEGVIELDGVELFVTCGNEGDFAQVYVSERNWAEAMLNTIGLSTDPSRDLDVSVAIPLTTAQ
jgi:hypothetical protein